jgi:hypothetical protein
MGGADPEAAAEPFDGVDSIALGRRRALAVGVSDIASGVPSLAALFAKRAERIAEDGEFVRAQA